MKLLNDQINMILITMFLFPIACAQIDVTQVEYQPILDAMVSNLPNQITPNHQMNTLDQHLERLDEHLGGHLGGHLGMQGGQQMNDQSILDANHHNPQVDQAQMPIASPFDCSTMHCDDANACNGIETCDSQLGCMAQTFETCANIPNACGTVMGQAQAEQVIQAPLGNLALVEHGFDQDTNQIIDELGHASGNQFVGISQINLNRSVDAVNSWDASPCFDLGFKWEAGDESVSYWYPQGITGTADANVDNQIDGQKYLIVSWYNKSNLNPADKPSNMGVRISLVNSTTISSARYRHMLLVIPTRDGDGRANFKILDIHAGGLVWYQNYLYVADTENGFRVFDLSRIIEVSILNQIGFNGNGYGAFEYRYVVPQIGYYSKCAESCCNRFSSASLDRSTNPPTLLTGYYASGDINGVSYRWSINDDGKLSTQQGVARPTQAIYMGLSNMQGFFSYQGHYFATQSSSDHDDRLYFGAMNEAVRYIDFGNGIEDLHYSPASDRLWSLTEHPSRRVVMGIKLQRALNGCQ